MRKAALLFLLIGCGSGDALVRSQMADMQKKLDDTQRRASIAERKAEDLQDQVFLLTDKLESQKVAHNAPPKLPVVLLEPNKEERAANDDDIVFEGAARSRDPEHTRPSLVLTGTAKVSPAKSAPAPAHSAPNLPVESPSIAPEGRGLRREPENLPAENLGVAPVPPIAKATAPDGAVKLYKDSYEALRAGRHDDARRGFRELVKKFPDHDLADNAQYWLGECFYDRKQFVEAMPEFRMVLTKYPLGNKAPDAMLKLAYCMLALGDVAKGREILSKLPETYPHTEAARLAQVRLSELRSTGGTQ
jgi:tol-pal system protein YbgF